ncbi:MAG: malonyl-CoA synthase [Steroidobacteraceae bacterium]
MTNLYRRFEATFRSHADRVLIESGARLVTGRELDDAAARYAAVLRDAGLKAGDRLAVQVEKSLENVFVYLGCLRLGAIYMPLNTAYQPAEISYFLGDATPRVLVSTPEKRAVLEPVANAAGVATLLTLGIAGDGDLVERAARAQPFADVCDCEDDDLAVICYTSGTTGRSKGAMITHNNLISNAATLVDLWAFTDKDVLLHALPLYHIHGLFVALHCAFFSGAKIQLLPKFDGQVVDALAKSTVMMGVPTFYTRLLADSRLDRDRVKTVRLFISGSAPLLPDTFAEFEARTGHRILERYGMTETQMISSNPLHGDRHPGTVGLPLPGVELRIADEHGLAVPIDEIGVIEVRGPNVCKGYWQMPAKTKAEIRPDGFFITGDLGMMEPDGYVRIVGRAKDLIISGGLNVYPKEIEEAIDALPGVAESAVFGVPHPDFGEVVMAAVVVKPGATVTESALIATLREQLAAFKTPKKIFLVPELPRNAMAKVQKAVLRQQFGDTYTQPRA